MRPIQSHRTLNTGGIGYKLINTDVDWLAKHTKQCNTLQLGTAIAVAITCNSSDAVVDWLGSGSGVRLWVRVDQQILFQLVLDNHQDLL